MGVVRILTTLLVLGLFACPEAEPPPPIRERKIPVEVPKVPKPKAQPKPVFVDDAPEPEADPAGTIYTWEDQAGGLHITQSPPPKDAVLKRKELPRAAPPPPKDTRPVVDARAKALVKRINGLRRNPIPSASSLPQTAGYEAAVKKLKGGRRAYASLSHERALDEALADGTPGAAFSRGRELNARSDDPEAALMEWVREPSSLEAILRPDASVIGARCAQRCRVIIARSTTRIR